MLHKIKTLRELIEPKANVLGISFEEILGDISEEARFELLMKQYKRKLSPKNYEIMNFMSNIIRLTNDCKLIKTYLEKEYYIKDSKYYTQFINYLHEIVNTRPESILHWRSSALLSNKNRLIAEHSSYEPYTMLKYKDVSLLFETLNIKPLYYLCDVEFSSVINDKGYENWIHSPVEKSDGTKYPWNNLNLKDSQNISQIYVLYIDYIVEKWIVENIDVNSASAKSAAARYGNYVWKKPIIKQVIFDNPACFKRNTRRNNAYIEPYIDHEHGHVDYNIPIPSDDSELSILIEHFTGFKALMNQLFTDKKIEELYYNARELDKKQSIRPETTWHRAVEQNKCAKGSADGPKNKYLSYLWSLSILEYYVNNPNELIIYRTLEYPNRQDIPAMDDLNQVLNEKSYWSKSLQKWDKTKYNKLLKKIKIKIKEVDKILESDRL